jgi:hypothetical protein
VFVTLLLAVLVACEETPRQAATPPPQTTPAAPSAGFKLVGHSPLDSRGMNAGLALHGRYAYVGSRTDGSHKDAGVLIVDVEDPASPRVVGQIGAPREANLGSSSRELRAWGAQNLLIVMSIPCEPALHRCAARSPAATVHFYDIGAGRGRAPVLVATYQPSETPHEMFLWTDPAKQARALLYLSTNIPGAGRTSLLVADISRARAGVVHEVLAWRGGAALPELSPARLHSVSVATDGKRAYLAYERAGLLLLETSQLARGVPTPSVQLLGAPIRRWPGPGAHSAVAAPGRNLVVVTEEVYGGHSACPWGIMRLVDVTDVSRPKLAGTYGLLQNNEDFCARAPRGSYTYSTHNPTPVGNLVLVSFHAGGLQAVWIRDPANPAVLAAFVPKPLDRVATEDPALTTGSIRVAVWSYPIVRNGLVYIVDVRNGLFILRLEALSRVAAADGASSEGS